MRSTPGDDARQDAAAERLTGRATSASRAAHRDTIRAAQRRAAERAAAKPEVQEPRDWLDSTAVALVAELRYTLLYDKYILGMANAELMAKHALASQATLARRVEALLAQLRSEL